MIYLRLSLLLSLLFLSIWGQTFNDSDKYQCNRGVGSIGAREFSPSSRSVFLSPCGCNEGWNEVFCKQSQEETKEATESPHTPTLCVCRKLSDENLRCEQFLTRCYKKGEGNCSCCFMQDEEHCDQVACIDNQPIFQESNTTCDCFSSPSSYPSSICNDYNPKAEAPMAQESGIFENRILNIFGRPVNAFLIIAIVVALIILVSFFTILCLCVSSKRSLKRAERELEARLARADREAGEAFLPQ